MEWYDFAVFGYLAGPLGHAFFPHVGGAWPLIASFSVFAAGYVMRPHDFVRQSIHRTWRKLTTKLLVLWRGQLIPNTSLEDVEDLLCKWASDRA